MLVLALALQVSDPIGKIIADYQKEDKAIEQVASTAAEVARRVKKEYCK